MDKAYHSGESEADNSMTPRWLINQLESVVNVNIMHDVCATEKSAVSKSFWSKEDNALDKNWADKLHKINTGYDQTNCLWMNPPFSQSKIFTLTAWQESIYGAFVLGCVKHAPDVDWFQEVERKATFIYVPDGRIQFLKHDGTPFTRWCKKQNKHVKSGANFPVCFPLWTPFNNGGQAKYVRFNRNKKAFDNQ